MGRRLCTTIDIALYTTIDIALCTTIVHHCRTTQSPGCLYSFESSSFRDFPEKNVLKTMNFSFKMMNYVYKMMNYVFKMVKFELKS